MRICSKCGEKYEGAEIFCPKDGARIIDPDNPKSNTSSKKITITPLSDSDPLIGSMIGNRYRVISRLGEGGMGVVYVVEHVEIEKLMALKILRDDFSSKPDVVERFRQEARSASKIGDPHIVDVTDFGQLKDGGVYFVMEKLEGAPLDELCNGETIELSRVVSIVDQIARGLKAAHDKGIVHRDLKPENVFLINRDEQRDFVKILDFGIAKISDRDSEGKRLTQTGMIFGTPEYMSPEQASGKPTDHRVDVYALGCIMFEMFTGKVPYTGDSFMAILTQHMFEPIPDIKEIVPDIEVPDSVLNVVYKAMAKETSDRYKDMQALRDDLLRALEDSDYIVDHPGRDQSISFSLSKIAGNRGSSLKSRKKNSGKSLSLLVVIAVSAVIIMFLVLFIFIGKKTETPVENSIPVIKSDPLPTINELSPVKINKPPKKSVQEQKIKVTLGSMPPGAIIQISGMGQVCSSAPCEVEVKPGEALEVTAVAGDISKKEIFTPSDQNTDLLIELDIPQKTEVEKTKKVKKPVKRTSRTPASKNEGLKIPDIFSNN